MDEAEHWEDEGAAMCYGRELRLESSMLPYSIMEAIGPCCFVYRTNGTRFHLLGIHDL